MFSSEIKYFNVVFKYSVQIKCQEVTCVCIFFCCCCCVLFFSCDHASHGSMRSPEVSAGDEQDDNARLEAERKLEELKRRRDEVESEEFERMRQKQQEAEAELEELKRKREERKKVLEEEERQRKQEEAERKAREEVISQAKSLLIFHPVFMLF